jgi:hypothetical protein
LGKIRNPPDYWLIEKGRLFLCIKSNLPFYNLLHMICNFLFLCCLGYF